MARPRFRCAAGRGDGLDRIEIGAKIVAGDASGGLDLENVFGGQMLSAIQPLPHGGLRHAAQLSKRGLTAD